MSRIIQHDFDTVMKAKCVLISMQCSPPGEALPVTDLSHLHQAHLLAKAASCATSIGATACTARHACRESSSITRPGEHCCHSGTGGPAQHIHATLGTRRQPAHLTSTVVHTTSTPHEKVSQWLPQYSEAKKLWRPYINTHPGLSYTMRCRTGYAWTIREYSESMQGY